MKVRVLAFATARDALGGDELTVELADGARLADLERHLATRHPDLVPLWPRLAVAVDGQVSSPETALNDGAEVALLPPVSGGATARLVEQRLSAEELLAEVRSPACGAVVLFAGTVRDQHRGRAVARLTYTAYRSMAEARLRTLVGELEASAPGLRVAIAHRLGTLERGEISVLIATASPHRDEAYRANREALERLKREVPIWKREQYLDGTAAWREEERLGPAAAPLSAPEDGPGRRGAGSEKTA